MALFKNKRVDYYEKYTQQLETIDEKVQTTVDKEQVEIEKIQQQISLLEQKNNESIATLEYNDFANNVAEIERLKNKIRIIEESITSFKIGATPFKKRAAELALIEYEEGELRYKEKIEKQKIEIAKLKEQLIGKIHEAWDSQNEFERYSKGIPVIRKDLGVEQKTVKLLFAPFHDDNFVREADIRRY